jgi:NADH dehydrogenase FAD-containing subunit
LLVQEHYPELMKDVKIRIIELMDHVLSTYDRKISEYTAKRFARAGAHTAFAPLSAAIRKAASLLASGAGFCACESCGKDATAG